MNKTDVLNKEEYECKLLALNQNIITNQTELNTVKISEKNLIKKIEELKQEVNTTKEFYNSKFNSYNQKYKNKKKFIEDLNNFFSDNIFYYLQIIDFFSSINEMNSKNFQSELFEKEINLETIDINNYQLILQKINKLNFILKIEDRLNFDNMFLNFSKEKNFVTNYNLFAETIFKLFETMLKILTTENSKIFFYTNNINNLIKSNIKLKLKKLILKKQLKNYVKASKTKSNNEKEPFNIETNALTNDILLERENNESSKDLQDLIENFEIIFSKIINNFEYKVVHINNNNLFVKNNRVSFYKLEKEN